MPEFHRLNRAHAASRSRTVTAGSDSHRPRSTFFCCRIYINATAAALFPTHDDAEGRVVYVDGDVLADASVRDSLAALVADGGPPLIAHRAKELMHGLDLDVRTLHHDTAIMAYLLDPGEGKYLLDALALRFLGLEVESPDAEPGTLDLSGDMGVEQTGRRAVAVLRLADELEPALEARELTDLYRRFAHQLFIRNVAAAAVRQAQIRGAPCAARLFGAGGAIP